MLWFSVHYLFIFPASLERCFEEHHAKLWSLSEACICYHSAYTPSLHILFLLISNLDFYVALLVYWTRIGMSTLHIIHITTSHPFYLCPLCILYEEIQGYFTLTHCSTLTFNIIPRELRYTIRFKQRLLPNCWPYGLGNGRVNGGERTG
jgi:hypothetical protein